ncbi:MAG: LysR family transcriptional regulator [Desulfomonile tiedjei]|nr:LysR family transcriptional regulator [Desulfomonile tiedjei]
MGILEIRHLRLIKTLSETENLTRAAEKLHVSQPALSQQLRELEDRLGTVLFQRTRRKMILTRMGGWVLKAAENVLEELNRVEREIGKAVHGETGVLRIGVHCMLSYQWLPSLMRKFHEMYPQVELMLNNSHTFIRDLKSDAFDLVITGFPVDHPEIDHRKLFEDEVVVVSSPHHPMSAKKTVSEADFEDITLISLVEKSKDLLYQYYLVSAGVRIRRFMTIEQPAAIIDMVRSAFGVALFPRWSVKTFLNSGELCASSLGQGGVRVEWRAVFLKSKQFPMYQEAFLKLLADDPLQYFSKDETAKPG